MGCSEELVLNRVPRGGIARIHVDLVVDGAQVSLHRAQTEDQLVGDLCIGHALGHQAQHVHSRSVSPSG